MLLKALFFFTLVFSCLYSELIQDIVLFFAFICLGRRLTMGICTNKNSMVGNTVLITGGNVGIGEFNPKHSGILDFWDLLDLPDLLEFAELQELPELLDFPILWNSWTIQTSQISQTISDSESSITQEHCQYLNIADISGIPDIRDIWDILEIPTLMVFRILNSEYIFFRLWNSPWNG